MNTQKVVLYTCKLNKVFFNLNDLVYILIYIKHVIASIWFMRIKMIDWLIDWYTIPDIINMSVTFIILMFVMKNKVLKNDG